MCDVLKQKRIVAGNAMHGPINELRQILTRNNTRINTASTEMQYFHFYKLIPYSVKWLKKIRAKIPCSATADDKEKSQISFV